MVINSTSMKHCKGVQFLLLMKSVFKKKTRKPERQRPESIHEEIKLEIVENSPKPSSKKVCKICKLETIEEECETPTFKPDVRDTLFASGVS